MAVYGFLFGCIFGATAYYIVTKLRKKTNDPILKTGYRDGEIKKRVK